MPESYIPIAVRRQIIEVSKGYCEYCQLSENFATEKFQFDHIIAVSLGGKSLFENLARTCGWCNNEKRDKIEFIDPFTQETVRLFNPRSDKWSEHFRWSEDGLFMIGTTSIGRATIELLKTNHSSVVNLRKLLKKEGLHPPDL